MTLIFTESDCTNFGLYPNSLIPYDLIYRPLKYCCYFISFVCSNRSIFCIPVAIRSWRNKGIHFYFEHYNNSITYWITELVYSDWYKCTKVLHWNFDASFHFYISINWICKLKYTEFAIRIAWMRFSVAVTEQRRF